MAGNKNVMPELRDAFGETLVELGCEYENILFLDADLHTSTKATMFKDRFPERFYQIGIAEQNLFGVAGGLALEGFIPFASTFAAFAARRALDQISITIAFPKLNVKIPGSYVGIPTSRAGGSHNCIEDIAVMRATPNILVADPGSNRELTSVMRAAVEVNGPVYFRIARIAVPEFFGSDYVFEWGKGVIIVEGNDISLFSTGIMTDRAIKAADILRKEGIFAEVVHLGSIKPIDEELILQSTKKTGCCVASENANINGGFASAVAEVLGERNPVPLQRIGIRDRFIESGGIEELFHEHSMQPENIAAAAKEAIKQRDRKHERKIS